MQETGHRVRGMWRPQRRRSPCLHRAGDPTGLDPSPSHLTQCQSISGLPGSDYRVAAMALRGSVGRRRHAFPGSHSGESNEERHHQKAARPAGKIHEVRDGRQSQRGDQPNFGARTGQQHQRRISLHQLDSRGRNGGARTACIGQGHSLFQTGITAASSRQMPCAGARRACPGNRPALSGFLRGRSPA